MFKNYLLAVLKNYLLAVLKNYLLAPTGKGMFLSQLEKSILGVIHGAGRNPEKRIKGRHSGEMTLKNLKTHYSEGRTLKNLNAYYNAKRKRTDSEFEHGYGQERQEATPFLYFTPGTVLRLSLK